MLYLKVEQAEHKSFCPVQILDDKRCAMSIYLLYMTYRLPTRYLGRRAWRLLQSGAWTTSSSPSASETNRLSRAMDTKVYPHFSAQAAG